ncbi:MAG: trigger factor [Verrucomicrobia bacterium]|nr:trigger factor [Verrucomicrobiota bacterium]
MNVTLETLAPCRRLMRVEVEAQAVEAAFEKVTSDFQRHARFPGFRPGKAPRDRVAKTYAKEIEEETKKELLSENFRKAVKDQKLNVVSVPDIEEIQFERGQPLQFAATIEIAPEFELPEYRKLPVRREVGQVTDADIERALDVLREQRATYVDVARPVQAEDFVVVNYTGTSEGKPLAELVPDAPRLAQQNNFWVHIKPGSFIPGFGEQLIGGQAGEHRSITVDFPDNFVSPQLAGRKAAYEVDVVQVKQRVLPELNDELARVYGAEDMTKLREGVRQDLQNELNFKQRKDVRNQIVRALLDRVQFDLPESMVISETRNVIYDIVRENQQRGISKESIDKQKDEIYNFASASAKERVKISFLLKRIAEKEGIRADEHEITQKILLLAHQHQMKPDKLTKQLRDRGGLNELHEEILTTKVLDFLELHAQVEEVPVSAGTA